MTIDINHTQNTLIFADQWLDYVPFLSSFSNGIELIAKVALKIIESYAPSLYESIKDDLLVKHLQDKHAFVCVLLMVPIFNIFVALVYNGEKNFQTEEKRRKERIDNLINNTNEAMFNLEKMAEEICHSDDEMEDLFNPAQTLVLNNEKFIKECYQKFPKLAQIDKEVAKKTKLDSIQICQSQIEQASASIENLQYEIGDQPKGSVQRNNKENYLQRHLKQKNFLLNKAALFT